MKLPLIIAALVGAGVVVGLLTGAFGTGENGPAGVPPEALHRVTRGTLVVTLTENGTLVAKDSQKLSTGTESSSKLTFLVEEGKQVEQGEQLAKLDTTELETDQQQIQLDIVQADANLATSKSELEIQRADSAAAIEKAQMTLDKTRKDLEKYRDGEAPGERVELEVAISDAETQHGLSNKKFEDSQVLFAQDYINKSQVELDGIEARRTEVKLQAARRNLQLFENYTLPMTTIEKDAAVRDAERERGNADLRSQSALRQKEVAVEQNEKRLTRLRERLERNQKEIAKMSITAPSPGIVLYGDPDEPWQRDQIRLGGEIWGGMVVITLPDLRIMQVKLQVHEADVAKLKPGQGCKITMDTYPGIVLDGEVTKIAAIAGSGNPWERDSEVKKFDVSVTLDDTGVLQLKPGISAKAEIFIEERPGVLHVPLQCVFPREGKTWCWIVNGSGQPEAREVTTGTSNDQSVEIVAGLNENDHVLLYNPSLPQAGDTESKPAEDEQADEDETAPAGDGDGGSDGAPGAAAAAAG